MRTLSEIIVKRDYTQKPPSSIFYEDSPTWQKLLCIGFVGLIALAGLGEWKTINNSMGGLPKIVTVGIICMTFAYGIIYPDLKRLKKVLWPSLIYLSLIASLLLWSMVIWLMSFSNLSTMIRACSKLVFQSISILTAICGVYLFGSKAVDLFTIGVCLSNAGIMLLEIPSFGLAASIQSLITCLVTFGDAEGYARNLEIHDLTFVFGQLVLYYAAFAPHETRQENRRRWLFLIACTFFFLVGMKRIAIPAVILFIVIAYFVRRFKNKKPLFILWGIAWVVFFFLYLYGVRTGVVSQILKTLGIDMMGRDYLWSLANDYYDFSIGYFGHGFEYVDTIVGIWYSSGLINHAYPFHNDILKVFVELGFPGFVFWSGIQYISTTVFWTKYADDETTLLYLCNLSYMTVTYLTDNTSFSFWCTMALRLIPLAYSVNRRKPPKPQVWKPHNKKEMHERINILMQESQNQAAAFKSSASGADEVPSLPSDTGSAR